MNLTPPLRLPTHLRDKIATILGPHIFTASREDALMQAATAVLDAKAELDHCKLQLEAVRGEIHTLAAIQLKQRRLERLVITRAELDAIPLDQDIRISAPEPGVRIYELVRKSEVEPPKQNGSPILTQGIRRALNS